MAIVAGCASVRNKNARVMIKPIHDDLFNLTLIKDKVYDIGIDQSSSCTGIAIASTDNDVFTILEVKNNAGDKFSYYREVKSILRKIVHNMKIRLVICEDPPPVKNKRYTSTVLLELRGRVSEWMEEIPEFTQATFKSIYPQTWKSMIVDKTKGTGRSNDKAMIAEDICDILPEFNQFRTVYASRDYDGFDAFGILLGYRKYAYTEEGLPLICGKIEKRHTSFIGYRYVSANELSAENVHQFLGNAVMILKPTYLMYNERYNRFDNIRMATSNWDCSYTIMPVEEFDRLKWEYDLEYKEDHIVLGYMFNYSHWPQATKSFLKSVFDMYEEVTTC